ncbi:MAG: hypothetical protein ACRDDW_00410 [Candidatus Rhabdochlamydia sp.]
MTTPLGPGSSHIFFVSSAPFSPPQLSAEEKEYVKKLVSIMPLDSILTDEKVERECKEFGQKIFDKVKAAHDSFAAKDAVKRVCNSIYFSCNDGNLRKQYIEYAWDGIGDDTWRWQH